MEIWYKYTGHDAKICGKKKKFDNNIYTFDIETSNFIELDGVIYPAIYYDKLDKKTRKRLKYYSNMYIWMFGINDKVYYGRTWDELKAFLDVVNGCVSEEKYLFIHNLSFEFQYMKNHFNIEDVMARKSRHVMTCKLVDYNFNVRCSYMMSNSSLSQLPKIFKLPVEKKVGDLDYDLIRHQATPLTDKELGYCEYDCLVVYYYILEELKTYEYVAKLHTTSTGHVRRELYNLTLKDFKYKRLVRKSINDNPHVYNLLVDAFMGGITHASYIYAGEVLEKVDSYDITSSYPYTLVSFKFPSSEFVSVDIKSIDEMSKRFCYLLVVEFKNVKSKYYNTLISSSKCRNLRGCVYDNGRVIKASSFEMTLTDIDFYLIMDCYNIEEYTIKECYYANKSYLPLKFINFVLDKYVAKTKYKDVEGMEVEYQKQKNLFNACYGMAVTNEIRANVIYDDITKDWEEVELTNEEIEEKLIKQKKKAFLNFAMGVWVTSIGRDCLFRRVMDLDDYVVYMDTDSIKLVQGYDKSVFIKYNEHVKSRIENISKLLHIDFDRYAPVDVHGKSHLLGVYEYESNGLNEYTYNRFITQGAKKYAFERLEKDKKTGEINNKISITVAGVPKDGYKKLNTLDEFQDGLVFDYDTCKKKLVMYTENQESIILKDYLGNDALVTEKSGCCILPNSYELGKAENYMELLEDISSKRARYKE